MGGILTNRRQCGGAENDLVKKTSYGTIKIVAKEKFPPRSFPVFLAAKLCGSSLPKLPGIAEYY